MTANKVLFVMAKHDRCTPEWGPSTFSVYPRTLSETGFVESVSAFYLDEMFAQSGSVGTNEMLLQWCAVSRPDLIVFIPTGWVHIDPSRIVTQTIMEKLGAKVCLIRGDAAGEQGHQFNHSWFPFVSAIAFVDITVSSLGYSRNPKAIQGFICANNKDFYDRKIARDLDVSFAGSVGNWLNRADYLEFLKASGVDVFTGGGLEFDTKVSIEDYSKIINRSKISLSFCLHRTEGFSMLKGRVFDIMCCQSFLLEDAGTETAKLFDAGKDFVMYNSKEEMLEKIQYYLKHDRARQKIAEAGHRKVAELYTPRNLWAHILERTGFDISDEVGKDTRYLELSRKLEMIRWGI